jgi:basic membrane protein A
MRIVQGALVAVLALGLGGAQAQEKKLGEKLKVGFVYVGPVADYGYS